MEEFCFYLLIILLFILNWWATTVVLIVPHLVSRFIFMVGNWANHAFIDPNEPNNIYKNSINIIESFHNRRNFNDGYHIEHHFKPSMHWADLPAEFEVNVDNYVKNDAIVFKKINYIVIWYWLMTKNYKKLAQNFVQLAGADKRSNDEIIALLKSRTIAM